MLQLHKPSFSKIPLIDVYKDIQILVSLGKVKYIGISNASLEQLSLINKEIKIDFFEGIYNLECKIYEDIKVLDYCNKNDIKVIKMKYDEQVKCIVEVNEEEKQKLILNIQNLNFKIHNYQVIKKKNIKKH